MKKEPAIAVVGTFDSKAEEHTFLNERISQKGLRTLTVNVGTQAASPVPVNLDLYEAIAKDGNCVAEGRDRAISVMLRAAQSQIKRLYEKGEICAIISAGGGTGTHICTTIMRDLPLGVPKVMISTVASRNMAEIVSTKDITMIHSVADLLGVNSISGIILDKAAAAVCAILSTRYTCLSRHPTPLEMTRTYCQWSRLVPYPSKSLR